MTDKRTRRRGKGGLSRYKTAAGERWRWRLYVPIDVEHPEQGEKRIGKAGFSTMSDAEDSMQAAVSERRQTGTVQTNDLVTFGDYARTWLDGRRLASTTLIGYEKKLNAHIYPNIGTVPLNRITAARLAKLYRDLERSGRADKGHEGEGLGPNSVRKVHTIISSVLQAAVDEGLLQRNVARSKTANPPTMTEIEAAKDEINPWTVDELQAFTTWAADNDDLAALWFTAAHTGLRRGELLALRWGDIDLARKTLSVRRAVVVVKTRPERLEVKKPKSGHTRVVDLDEATIITLKKWRSTLAQVNIAFTARNANVFGRLDDNGTRHPDNVSRRWRSAVDRCARYCVERQQTPPHEISLHDVRHTHATLMLQAGVHPKVVQERLGHSTITITLNLYSHVLPTVQREAVAAFERLLETA
ncbi:tyrosine-type recombinase/integrase [Pseudoclavibacter sp. CFCC 13611]|uniref:tyrosine-type recombinase/integrase n=1 Tax=Pseudoclavibacter sp. CFCC 13611 TaxID=2615178 RepID=UPI001787EFC2|nr:site-specific integrase [Pseudoclavibacter sp. CFCC 13611]